MNLSCLRLYFTIVFAAFFWTPVFWPKLCKGFGVIQDFFKAAMDNEVVGEAFEIKQRSSEETEVYKRQDR